jgi:FkbM family methyltransferase
MGNIFLKLIKPLVEKFPRVSFLYRHLRDNWPRNLKAHDTVMGFKLVGHIKSTEAGLFEPEESKLFCKILPKVDYVINIGANTGYYCCLALKEGKRVIAFEPIMSNLRLLLKNIEINNWASLVEVYPIAISNNVGISKIYGGRTSASLTKGWAGVSDNYMDIVPCSTLDNVLGHKFKSEKLLILADIEGSELLMLTGAKKFLFMNPKPIWLVEICFFENQPNGVSINPNIEETFKIFWESGYQACTADTFFRVISINELEEMIHSTTLDIKSTSFLFYDKDEDVFLPK